MPFRKSTRCCWNFFLASRVGSSYSTYSILTKPSNTSYHQHFSSSIVAEKQFRQQNVQDLLVDDDAKISSPTQQSCRDSLDGFRSSFTEQVLAVVEVAVGPVSAVAQSPDVYFSLQS